MNHTAPTHTNQAHETHDDGRVHAHISTVKFLVGVFAALIFLTFVTVYVSYFDFGEANTFVAVLIATMKATLVALFFMHLRYDKAFHGVVFIMGFLFLGLFLLFAHIEIRTRGYVDEASSTTVLPRTGAPAPGGIEPSARVPRARATGGSTAAGSPAH